MQKFNEYGTITEDVTPAKDLHVVIMGLGEEEGTFAEIMQKLCKKRGIKNTLINILFQNFIQFEKSTFFMVMQFFASWAL